MASYSRPQPNKRTPITHFWLLLFAEALFGALPVSSVHGQDDPNWGAKLFNVTELKFGKVAKGAAISVPVKVKNIFREEIHITRLMSRPGCFWWDASDSRLLPITIPSGEERLITLHCDTVRFSGIRNSKAIVQFLDPVHGVTSTVELPANVHIRQDLELQPGSASFGTVEVGAGAERKIDIRYTGAEDWRLSAPKMTSPDLSVVLHETDRQPSLVRYELTVKLKPETAAGKLREIIRFETNEATSPVLAVPVDGEVVPEIQISEAQFGAMYPGQTKTLKVIIRALRPVEIGEVRHEMRKTSTIHGGSIQATFQNEAAVVHIVSMKLTAPNELGAFDEEFLVKFADRPVASRFQMRGRVIERTSDE